jgi:hypothetical protein
MIDFNDRMHDGDMDPHDAAALFEPQHRGVNDVARNGAADENGGRAQAERIMARNRELVRGDAAAGPEGEREVGVGRTVSSDSSHHGGDYSSD